MKAARKSSATRRAAALAFLSGISLDGKPDTTSHAKPTPTTPQRKELDNEKPTSSTSKTEVSSKRPTTERCQQAANESGHVTQQQVMNTSVDATSKTRRPSAKRTVSMDALMYEAMVRDMSGSRHLKNADWKSEARGTRLIITSTSGLPVAIFSTVRYKKGEGKDIGIDRHRPGSIHSESRVLFSEGIDVRKSKNSVSYGRMLESTQESELCHEHRDVLPLPMSPVATECVLGPVIGKSLLHLEGVYNPNVFDDPELQSGKYRKVITMPSYRLSVLEYARPSHIKRDLNDQFRERFPHVQLTLSKLRAIKKCLLKISLKCSLDLLVVALAYVYFEKFVWKLKVNKANRKISAGCCLLLAAKMLDLKRVDIRPLMDGITDGLHISHRDLLQFEFPVLVALEFSLHIPHWEVQPHLDRLESSF